MTKDQSVPTAATNQVPRLLRDSRGSLEVFNPTTSFSDHPPTNQSPSPTCHPSWPALPSKPTEALATATVSSAAAPGSSSAAAQRAAEWGLVLKTNEETGKPQGVSVRNSGEKRESGQSYRSSEDSDDGRVKEKSGMPRVSEELREALSAFQQTFVVSDATKPDYPIMYASAGFFNMTGYLSKEVIGRNCRFLQGADTDPAEIAKLREALAAGSNYCGRILNYKKDGTPFWNLLTVAPIKDETGTVLKYIGMQVEVSKHTEGAKDTIVRPNGLPESLIKYDARQKDKARSSLSELVLAVKRPRALSESTNRPFRRRSEGSVERLSSDSHPRRNSENDSPVPSARRTSRSGMRSPMQKINELPQISKKSQKSGLRSFMGLLGIGQANMDKHDVDVQVDLDPVQESDDERPESFDDQMRKKEMRKGIDLATTLERIEKNFVITDPRLPDNPIIFASDSFLELTEYSREEILGRNCRFLQGPETDRATVRKIRDAIDNQHDVTVQLINYTKSGKKFWNLFHLQPMRDQKGEVSTSWGSTGW